MDGLYLKRLRLVSAEEEINFSTTMRRASFNGMYPFKMFPYPYKELEEVVFAPITIFCGGNGSGKSTLLNVIAEKLRLVRHSEHSGGEFFPQYVALCEAETGEIPKHSQFLASDDVFEYMLHIRSLNNGIDTRREVLLQDYLDRQHRDLRFRSLADYDDWKETYDASRMSDTKFVRERLMQNVNMHSNGESAMKFFVHHITENALYLLDEPENSMAVPLQEEFRQYLIDSSRFYGCQFVIATHSPILLSIPGAVIYDLETKPVEVRKWTEIENVRRLRDFFARHAEEFA